VLTVIAVLALAVLLMVLMDATTVMA